MSSIRSLEPLTAAHRVDEFDCGQDSLNSWLQKHALQTQRSNGGNTFVALVDGAVVGFFTLVVGSVEYTEAPERLRKGLSRNPVPVMILARLAVSRDWQGKGVGRSMLQAALAKTLEASKIAGIRALLVHAKDDAARAYYERFDFEPSPTDPLHLALLVKDIQAQL